MELCHLLTRDLANTMHVLTFILILKAATKQYDAIYKNGNLNLLNFVLKYPHATYLELLKLAGLSKLV